MLAWLAFAGVAFFWGTTFLAIRIGVMHMPPFLMAGSRHFIAGILLCSYFLIRGYGFPNKQALKQFTINGILMLVLGNGLVTWAEKYISSGLAALVCTLTPLSIIAMNHRFGKAKEHLKSWGKVGLIICLIAQVIIFRDHIAELSNPLYLGGLIAIIIAISAWGLGSVYNKNNQSGLHPLYGAGLQMLSAGFILLVFGFSIGEANSYVYTHESTLAILYLIIFGSIIGYGCYMYVLKQLPATVVSTYAYINTLVAVVLGWLILEEKMNVSIGVAALLTITGVWLVTYNLKKEN